MTLRQLIKRKNLIASWGVGREFVVTGEPMIYSVKYNVGKRTRPTTVFRDKQWSSMLRCFFQRYTNHRTPLVLTVTFYVSASAAVKISDEKLRQEETPAVLSHELLEYVLSFMEMLHHTLFSSYRQIVRIDMEKYYSSNPRTVFNLMSWSDYGKLSHKNPVHSQG